MKEIIYLVFYVNKDSHLKIQQWIKHSPNPLNIELIDELSDDRYEYQILNICLPKMNIGECIMLNGSGIELNIISIDYFYEESSPHESYFMYICNGKM